MNAGHRGPDPNGIPERDPEQAYKDQDRDPTRRREPGFSVVFGRCFHVLAPILNEIWPDTQMRPYRGDCAPHDRAVRAWPGARCAPGFAPPKRLDALWSYKKAPISVNIRCGWTGDSPVAHRRAYGKIIHEGTT